MTLRRHRALGCLLRIAWLAGAALLVLALVGYVSTEQLQAFGSAPAGETPARIRASPEFHGDHLALLATPPASGYASHGLGHSGSLIELDGARILTDPQWSERASPTQLAGPSRFHPPPLAIAALPPLDAIVISHEHYDHLDMASVRALAAHDARAVFHVQLGIGPHRELP